RLAGAAPVTGLIALCSTGMTVYCGLGAARWLLLPPEPDTSPSPCLSALSITHDWLLLGAVAVAVHAARLIAAFEQPPTARWVGLSYCIAGAVGLGSVLLFNVVPVSTVEQRVRFYIAVQQLYVAGAVAYVLRQVIRVSRAGAWWPAGDDFISGRTRRADVLLY